MTEGTNDSDLIEQANAVGRATVFDRVVDGTLDAFSILVPISGPSIAAVARQVIPKDRDIYEHDYAVSVAERIERLEAGRVDPAYLHTNEWIADVEQVMEVVGPRKQRDKRRYFVAALANCATHDRPESVERKRFLDELERLRLSHLRLLSVLLLPPDSLGDGSTDGYLLARLPNQDLENIKLDWADLQAAGMLDRLPSGTTNTAKPVLIVGALRAFGRRFTEFIAAGEPDECDDDAPVA